MGKPLEPRGFYLDLALHSASLMKKQAKAKLALKSETVRALSTGTLTAVQGGVPGQYCSAWSCSLSGSASDAKCYTCSCHMTCNHP